MTRLPSKACIDISITSQLSKLQSVSGVKWTTSGCEIPTLFLSQLFRGVLEINTVPYVLFGGLFGPLQGVPYFKNSKCSSIVLCMYADNVNIRLLGFIMIYVRDCRNPVVK